MATPLAINHATLARLQTLPLRIFMMTLPGTMFGYLFYKPRRAGSTGGA
jgi:hypothetical protein